MTRIRWRSIGLSSGIGGWIKELVRGQNCKFADFASEYTAAAAENVS